MSKLRDACTGLAESRAAMERCEEFSREWCEHDVAHHRYGLALLGALDLPDYYDSDDLARPIMEALDAERERALEEVRAWLYERRANAVSGMYQRASVEFIRDFEARLGEENER